MYHKSEAVSASEENNVLTLRINRPEARNALNTAVMREMSGAIQEATASATVRAIVITGAGDRSFCAGGDLKKDSQTFGFDYARPSTDYADMLRTALNCPIPLVARVNGACLAGGMGLLAVCDVAVASADARFGLPEVKIGMFPMQVAAILQQLIPSRKFREMCLTGEPVEASEALDMQLVNYVVAANDLDSKVSWLLERIIGKSPTAIRRGKYALIRLAEMGREPGLAYAEAQIGTLVLTEDAVEGIAAFNEKRPPVWTGR